MLRFSRKPSAKDKQAKGKNSKPGKSKGKNKQPVAPVETRDGRNNLIGIQECRKLLASISKKKSAKCVATFRRRSQLSKTLVEVLMDDSVLPYFMEYMQKQNATNLLNFWLTVETFKLSTINRLRINTMSQLKSSKGESVNAIEDTSDGTSDSSQLYTLKNSVDGTYISSGTTDQLRSVEDDEFGDFTGYRPEPFSAVHSISKDASDSLLLCKNCGHLINLSLSKKDVCNHCGHNFDYKQTSNCAGGSNESFGSNEQQTIMNSSLENGINQPDCSNQSLVNNQGSLKTKEGVRTSKVTFDLRPDFEDGEHSFRRRRTRSIVIDAISIYSKYISLEASNPLGLEESIRRQIEINICSEDGKISSDSFQPAQKFAFDVMERMYFPAFLASPFYCKHQIDILTSGKVFLSDILYNQNAMFYFMEYLEQEGTQHMLEFWLTADNFQSHLESQIQINQYSAQHALSDAMIIYDKYFSMQATVPLGFDDVTRIEIENCICREGGPLPECFTKPMEHVLCLLEEVFFPSFLTSPIYYKYLTELLNSVSESQSSQTLSASVGSEDDVRRPGTHTYENSHLVKTTFGSDLDLTEDPDALWQRPYAGLSLGKVNEFGIFEPVFEPEPDRGNGTSKASKLGKALRKLVSGGEDKAKEEMAWKIAKMIIEDVKKEQTGNTSAGLWTEDDDMA